MIASRIIFASLLLAAPAWSAPTGKLGFVGAKGAQILNLRQRTVRSLPQGRKATMFALSPRGTAIYFVPVAGAKPNTDGGILVNGVESLPPYSSAKKQMALQNQLPNSLKWNPQGTALFVSTDKVSGAFTTATGRFIPFNNSPLSYDARQRTQAYSTEKQVIVRDMIQDRSRVLFDIRKPAPMFAALRAAKYPKKVKDLLSFEKESMVKDLSNWGISDPALAPDGARLYFASNAGTGSGAAGNCMFALFSVDLKTNKIAVLSKLGPLFGRLPHIFQVSPDGKRLLMASSVHDSAADNSCFVEVVDLLTQNSREVFQGVLPGSKNKANDLDSAVWSPDGKYVATSGYFYDANKALPDANGDWPEVKASQYTTGIVDAGTGRLVKTIKGTKSLSWVR